VTVILLIVGHVPVGRPARSAPQQRVCEAPPGRSEPARAV